MEEHDVRKLVRQEIRKHEVQVAILSGIPGLLLIAGTWHAIYMLARIIR